MHGNRIWSPAPEILMSWTFRVRTLAQPLKLKTLEDMGRRNEIEHQQSMMSMTHWHAFAGFHRPSSLAFQKSAVGRNPYDLNFSLWHSAPKHHAIVHAMIAIHFSPKGYSQTHRPFGNGLGTGTRHGLQLFQFRAGLATGRCSALAHQCVAPRSGGSTWDTTKSYSLLAYATRKCTLAAIFFWLFSWELSWGVLLVCGFLLFLLCLVLCWHVLCHFHVGEITIEQRIHPRSVSKVCFLSAAAAWFPQVTVLWSQEPLNSRCWSWFHRDVW